MKPIIALFISSLALASPTLAQQCAPAEKIVDAAQTAKLENTVLRGPLVTPLVDLLDRVAGLKLPFEVKTVMLVTTASADTVDAFYGTDTEFCFVMTGIPKSVIKSIMPEA